MIVMILIIMVMMIPGLLHESEHAPVLTLSPAVTSPLATLALGWPLHLRGTEMVIMMIIVIVIELMMISHLVPHLICMCHVCSKHRWLGNCHMQRE